MNKPVIFAVLAVVFLVAFLLIFKSINSIVPSGKKRVCPDEWIDNRMPSIKGGSDGGPSQYFIIDGERQEIEAYDLEWILNNCNIKPRIVY